MAPCQNHGASSTFSDETSNFQTLKTWENSAANGGLPHIKVVLYH
jgi:hypothetical protein